MRTKRQKKTQKTSIENPSLSIQNSFTTKSEINKTNYDCFIKYNKIYLRENEIKEIKNFIESNKPILHINGNPGTGKTATVLETVKGYPFEYVNYFTEPEIEKTLKKTKMKIVIIDEFDKFLHEKKQECLRILLKLKKDKKIITISNDLKMGGLNFKTYTSDQIIKIIKMKMNEIGKDLMDERCLEFIGKKFERTGDLREVFKTIANAMIRNENKLEIKDFINEEKKTERGIHQEMINKIKEIEKDRIKVYKEYLNECESMGIAAVLKGDFDLIYDLI